MSKLSEVVYKDLSTLEKKFIAPIDFGSFKELPESYAWADENTSKNPSNDKTKEEKMSIPVIDLNDPNVVEKIYHACETWGFLRITNHGVSNEIFEKVESQARRLFNLPHEEKMKVLRTPGALSGYGVPRFSSFFSKLMWCEGFTMMGDSIFEHAKVLWPNVDEHQEFCDVMAKYQTQMRGLSDKLLGLILESLNIPQAEMDCMNDDQENISSILHLNSYPKCPDSANAMGMAQHTDSFLFAILHQSGNASGLEVFKDGFGWVRVDPVPGTLVVNIADLLHIISNGRIHSAVHRAVVNNENHRISVVYFHVPPLDFEAKPYVGYPGCEGPLYKSMTVKEYVAIKAKLLESTLSSIKI